jgi:hypothetical protein
MNRRQIENRSNLANEVIVRNTPHQEKMNKTAALDRDPAAPSSSASAANRITVSEITARGSIQRLLQQNRHQADHPASGYRVGFLE